MFLKLASQTGSEPYERKKYFPNFNKSHRIHQDPVEIEGT